MPRKPKTFDHFPPESSACPICGSNEDGETILLPIDGTSDGIICEAAPVHMWCAVATNYSREIGVVYRRIQG